MTAYRRTDKETGIEITGGRHENGALILTVIVPDHDVTDKKQATRMQGRSAFALIRALQELTEPTWGMGKRMPRSILPRLRR